MFNRKPVFCFALGLVAGAVCGCQAFAIARPIGAYQTSWFAGPGYAYTQPYEYSDPMLISPGPSIAVMRSRNVSRASETERPTAAAPSPWVLTDPPILEPLSRAPRSPAIGGGPPRPVRRYDPAIVFRIPAEH